MSHWQLCNLVNKMVSSVCAATLGTVGNGFPVTENGGTHSKHSQNGKVAKVKFYNNNHALFHGYFLVTRR